MKSKKRSGSPLLFCIDPPYWNILIGVMNLQNGKWKLYVFWIGLCLGIGGLSGWLIREGTKIYSETITKPFLSPPEWIFPVVWSILYILMGISAAKITTAEESGLRSIGLNLFVLQLVFNFFWAPVFFNAQAFGFALFLLAILWILVLRMIYVFRQLDPAAGNLQIPYLIWLSFALYLNYAVWILN